MGTRMTVVNGSFFDAGISDAGPMPAAPGAAPKAELPDTRLATLIALFTDHLEKDSEESRMCQQLMGSRMRLNKQVDAFFERLRAPMRQKAIDEHEAVKGEARAKQKELSDMRATAAEWQRELLKAKDAQARAMTTLRDTDQDRKSLSRFSPRSAFSKADEAVEAAEKRVDKANVKVAEIQQSINAIALTELPQLLRELDTIAARETELDARISGKSYTDSFGIVHPARRPL